MQADRDGLHHPDRRGPERNQGGRERLIVDVPTHNVVRRQLGRIDGQARKTFQILGKGGKTVLIVRRTSKKRHPLEVLRFFKGEAHVTAHWAFKQSVSAIVEAKFAEFYMANLETAVER